MKDVILTAKDLVLDGHTISLLKPPLISSGVDGRWIDARFLEPKRNAFLTERARSEGYDEIATDGVHYFFFHDGKGIGDESSRQVACSDLVAQMPPLPCYTKFLGVDLEDSLYGDGNGGDNEKLKQSIDCLGLDQLETMIRKNGFVGRSRRLVQIGPSGVIIAMSDDYTINVKY